MFETDVILHCLINLNIYMKNKDVYLLSHTNVGLQLSADYSDFFPWKENTFTE